MVQIRFTKKSTQWFFVLYSACSLGLVSTAHGKSIFPSHIYNEVYTSPTQRNQALDKMIGAIQAKMGFVNGKKGKARLSLVIGDLAGMDPNWVPWGADAQADDLFCGASTLKAPAFWAVLQKVREGDLVVDRTGAETPGLFLPQGVTPKPSARKVLLQDLEMAIRPSNNPAAFRMVMSLDSDPQRALQSLNRFFFDVGLRDAKGGLFLGSAYNSNGPSELPPPEIGDTSTTTRQVVTPRMLTKFQILLDRCRVFPTDDESQVDKDLCRDMKELMRFRNPEENAKVNSTPDKLAKMILTKYPSLQDRPTLLRKTGSLFGEVLPTCYLDTGIVDRGTRGKYAVSLVCQEAPNSALNCRNAIIEEAARLLDDQWDEFIKN